MWFLLALTSTFLYSFRRLTEKELSQKINPFTLAFALQFFSLPAISLMLFFTTIPSLSSLSGYFWIPLLIIWIFLYPTQGFFYYKSLKEGELSYVLPLAGSIPIFNVVISWLLLGEIPSFVGFLGILSIVAGIYALNIKPNTHIISPITHLFRDRPSLFMIINCLCLALGTSLDKVAINASNPLFYSFVNTLGASVVLFIMVLLTSRTKFYSQIIRNTKGLMTLGLIQSFAFTAFILALSIGIVPYVAAIKSSSAILGSIWGLVFLKEPFTRYKTLALIFIFLGLVLIALA